MAPISNTPDAGQSPWFGIIKFLLLVILIALIFCSARKWYATVSFAAGGSTSETS